MNILAMPKRSLRNMYKTITCNTKGLIRKHFIAIAPKHVGRSLIIADKHRVLTLTQCEWILYESCHKFFMKATQILYAFCFAQHRVGESNSCVRTF